MELINVQINNATAIERGRINFKKSPKERITQSYLETRLESLEEHWQIFGETHRRIIEKAPNFEHSYFTSEVYEKIEEMVLRAVIPRSTAADEINACLKSSNC